jgi:hypothetical protein
LLLPRASTKPPSVGVDVLAEGARGVLVLPDRLEDAAPGAAYDEPEDDRGDDHEAPADGQDPQPVVAVVERPEVEPPIGVRVEVVEARGEAGQAGGAAGVLAVGDRTREQPDDVRGRDGRDGEVVGAQPQRRYAEQQGEHDGGHEADEEAEPQRAAEVGDRDAHAV